MVALRRNSAVLQDIDITSLKLGLMANTNETYGYQGDPTLPSVSSIYTLKSSIEYITVIEYLLETWSFVHTCRSLLIKYRYCALIKNPLVSSIILCWNLYLKPKYIRIKPAWKSCVAHKINCSFIFWMMYIIWIYAGCRINIIP